MRTPAADRRGSRPITCGPCRSGARQADLIRDQLADAGITRVLSSPAVRCVETVRPLAGSLGLDVEVDERLAEGTPVARATTLVLEVAATGAVLCSHGDLIPDLLDAQLAMGMRTDDDLRWPKASTWVLTWDGEAAGSARYLAPPG